MGSTVQKALVGSEIIKENWDAVESEIVIKTDWTADAWNRQYKQLLWAQKSSMNSEQHMWAQKSSMKAESLLPKKLLTKLVPRQTHGFDNANSSCSLKNHQRKLSRCRLINHQRSASTADAWIRQRKQLLWAMKSSTKRKQLMRAQKSSMKNDSLLP